MIVPQPSSSVVSNVSKLVCGRHPRARSMIRQRPPTACDRRHPWMDCTRFLVSKTNSNTPRHHVCSYSGSSYCLTITSGIPSRILLPDRYFSSVLSTPFSDQRTNRNLDADPNTQRFLEETATLSEKEQWLNSLLQSSNVDIVVQQDPSSKTTTTTTPCPSVNVHAFVMVLKALAAPNAAKIDPGVPRRAEMWMNRLRNLYSASNYPPSLQPTVECYQHIIQAWANADKEQPMVVVNRSERWLKEMLEECSEEDYNALLPIVAPYDKVQEEEVDSSSCTTTTKRYPQHNVHHQPLQPTIACFNAFLDGCTRGRPGKNKKSQEIVTQNAQKAERILRGLISYYHHDPSKKAAVTFDTDTCNFVIRGWTRCKHDDTIHIRVLSIVRLMESYQRNNPLLSNVAKPNTKTYCMAMDALTTVAKLKARIYYQNVRDNNTKNNHHSRYHHLDDEHGTTTALSSFQQQQRQENPSRNGKREIDEAHDILQYMHQLYDAGVEGVVPSRIPYNILITGWSGLAPYVYSYHSNNNDSSSHSSGNHQNDSPPFKAEQILRTMMSHRDDGLVEAAPDVISYEKVMLTWANSGLPNAGKRAAWWLKQLWKEYEHSSDSSPNKSNNNHKNIDLRPTVGTYNIVLKALTETEGALAAENLLLDLGERYQNVRIPELCPNSESFAIVIRAWLRSAEETKHNIDNRVSSLQRAMEWLSSLREIENEKNLSTAPELYNSVIRLCRSAAHPNRPYILEMAQEVFDNFKQSRHRVDYLSYAALLQVGLKVYKKPEHGAKRREFVESLFLECCDDGLLSNLFLRALSNDASPECRDMIDNLKYRWPLPVAWTRNLRNKLTHPIVNDLSATVRNSNETQKRRARHRILSDITEHFAQT